MKLQLVDKIILSTRKSEAIDSWMKKEYGSWEDSNYSKLHPYTLLKRFGGNVILTTEEANVLLLSAKYHSDPNTWDDEDIIGGKKTKDTIGKYAIKIHNLLESI